MLLEAARVTASGRPVYFEGEFEQATIVKVDLLIYDHAGKATVKEYQEGYALLTNQRLLWVCKKCPEDNVAIPLVAISQVTERSGFHRMTGNRLGLQVCCDAAGRPVPADASPTYDQVLMGLHCRDPAVAAFAKRLQVAVSAARTAWRDYQRQLPASSSERARGADSVGPLAAGVLATSGLAAAASTRPEDVVEQQVALVQQLQAIGFGKFRAQRAVAQAGLGLEACLDWLLAREDNGLLDLPPSRDEYQPFMGPPPPLPAPMEASASVGVAGILRREELRVAATDRSMEAAFQDLDALMGKAQEMVQLAQKFRQALEAGTLEAGEQMDAQLEADLMQLGIASPVTRDTAGSLYFQQLARELADFLAVPIERAGGLMPLPDVYCLFNRARGSELISPDDLLAAIARLQKVGAPLRLHKFSSGITVLQSDSFSPARMCAAIAKLVAVQQPGLLGPPLTATDVAASMQVPITIAGEYLLSAEQRGVLCRDDGPQGLRFFRNFFVEC